MSRKLIMALIGLVLLTITVATPVVAATSHLVTTDPSGAHVLFIPVIIMVVYALVGGVLSIAFLIWAYNNHKWPFDGTFHF